MPYSVKGFFEVSVDLVQILLMLEVLLTQNSEVEDLFCSSPSGSEPSLFFELGFKPFKMTYIMTLLERLISLIVL